MIRSIKKYLIIGIITLFVISALNPILIQSVKADDPIIDLVLTIELIDSIDNKLFEDHYFKVTVSQNGYAIEASVYYRGKSHTGSSVTFTADEVNAAKDVAEVHYINADVIIDSITHKAKDTPISVYNRYLIITNSPNEVNDNEEFSVTVEEKGNSGLKGGVTVSIDKSGHPNDKTGVFGTATLRAPIHTPDEGKEINYHISATKDGCIPADPVDLKVINTNIEPYRPDKPKVNGIDYFHVGVNPVTAIASTDDPDRDELMYEFDWGDNTETEWNDEYAASGSEVSLSHLYKIKVPDGGKEFWIRARAKDNGVDEYGNSDPKGSEYSLGQMVTIINDQPTEAKVSGPDEFEGTTATLKFYGKDSPNENHRIYFEIFWGDGSNERCPETSDISSGDSLSQSHTYDSIGTYSVSVTVHDIYGKSKKSDSYTIKVGNLAPYAPSLTIVKEGKGTYRADVSTRDPNKDDEFQIIIKWNGEAQSTTDWLNNDHNYDTEGYTFAKCGIEVKKITAQAIDEHGAVSPITTEYILVVLDSPIIQSSSSTILSTISSDTSSSSTISSSTSSSSTTSSTTLSSSITYSKTCSIISTETKYTYTFKATASGGTAPYKYQWYLDSTSNPVSTSNPYTKTFTSSSTSKNYKIIVKISDFVGKTTTASQTITIPSSSSGLSSTSSSTSSSSSISSNPTSN